MRLAWRACIIDSVTASLGNIRGAALDDFLAWYARERDAERLRAAVSSLPAPLTRSVRWTEGVPRLVPFAWYPCELVHGVLDQLTVGLSDWERQHLARESADYVMETTLKGVYRAIFKAIVSPAMMARFSMRLWQLYYDTGESRVTIESPTKHRGQVSEWRGHHPFLCDVNRYSTHWLYRQLGCDQLVVKQIECIERGAKQCSTLATWSGQRSS
jgi:hypothetical protein